MTNSIEIGVAHVACPACDTVIPVTVTGRIDNDGRPTLVCDSDMTDLWAHAWTHEGDDDPAL